MSTSREECNSSVYTEVLMKNQWLSRIYSLVVLSCGGVCVAQSVSESPIHDANLVPRCHRVSLVSENKATNAVLILDKLRVRGELTEARIALTSSEEEGDVTVKVTGDARDATVFARRKIDGATATSKVVALAEFPGVIAGTVVDALHELCPAVMTSSQWIRSGREPLATTAVIQIAAARSLSVTSKTSAMDENKLARYLARQPEAQAWELKINSDSSSDDLRLEVDRDMENLIVWKYDVLNRRGDSLVVGSVAALNQKHATEAIARNVLRQLARCKPSQSSSVLFISKIGAGPLTTRQTYRVKLITDEPRTTGTLLNVTIDAEKLIATDGLGQSVLRIEAPDFEEAASSSIRDAVLDYPDQFMKFVGVCCFTRAALLGGYIGAALVSAPLAPKTHLIDLAWHDGRSYQSATLQVEARDVAPLMQALRALQHSQ